MQLNSTSLKPWNRR